MNNDVVVPTTTTSRRRPWRTMGLAAAVAIVLVTGALFVNGKLSAAADGSVGYVDVARLIDEYLGPVLDEPLSAETARLQAEFDQQAQHLDDEEKQALFT